MASAQQDRDHPRGHRPLSESAVAAVVIFSATVSTFFASTHLAGRAANRAETIAMQFAILRGDSYTLDGVSTYLPANQNRVLFPLLLKGLSSVMASEPAYVAARFACAAVLFLALWVVARRLLGADPWAAGASVMLTAFALPFTFTYPFEQTSDFLDGVFTLAFLALALRRRRILFLLVAIVAAANRESAVFAGVIWACMNLPRTPGRRLLELAFAAGVSVSAYAAVLGLRFALGGWRAVGTDTQTFTGPAVLLQAVSAFVSHPQPTAWPVLAVAAAAPVLLWLYANRDGVTATVRGMLYASAATALGSLVFGIPNELRIFIPGWVLLVTAAAGAASGRVTRASMVELR